MAELWESFLKAPFAGKSLQKRTRVIFRQIMMQLIKKRSIEVEPTSAFM